MPYLAKSLQSQIFFIGMTYVETVSQFGNKNIGSFLVQIPGLKIIIAKPIPRQQ